MIRSFLLTLCALLSLRAYAADPVLLLPKTGLRPDELAVIVNIDDGLSRAIGKYYQQRRGIPDQNIIRIRFKPHTPAMDPAEFLRLWDQVKQQTPENVQAYALTWALPYRVGCMSITSAFATGFDTRYCAAKSCNPTQQSPYFNSSSSHPYRDFKLRPTMSLAASSFADAKALIDRGIDSDSSFPEGTAYLLSTSDRARNVRAVQFPETVRYFQPYINIQLEKSDTLRNARDVLFYFTGLAKVANLDTLHFVPGAIADHLTSAGGILDSNGQMSSLRWLEAGATGSYGTVIEPCNYQQKFPIPGIVLQHYLLGETLIEAYWKSVAWPGEGIFIGEPLANPYGGYRLTQYAQGTSLRTFLLQPGRYRLESANNPAGPYTADTTLTITHSGIQNIELDKLTRPYYRLVRLVQAGELLLKSSR
jgi:uncharacterized protein (TIGR03790 family)